MKPMMKKLPASWKDDFSTVSEQVTPDIQAQFAAAKVAAMELENGKDI